MTNYNERDCGEHCEMEESMISYKDRIYCCSDVEVHTCGREFTEQDAKDAEEWWGGKDYPVAYMKLCEEVCQ